MSGVAEAAVVWQLLQTAEVTNLVGDRVFPGLAPQDTPTPYLSVLRPPGQEVGRTGVALYGVSRTPLTVACVGVDYEESRSLSPAVVAALDSGWAGGSKFWNGTEVASCSFEGSFDHSGFPQVSDEIGYPVEWVMFELEHAS